MTPPVILVDVDGVLADLVGKICQFLPAYTPEHFTSYEFDKVLSVNDCRYVYNLMGTEGFCSLLPWYPGARGFLAALHALGDVIAVTKPFVSGKTWAFERELWLKGHVDKVIHTGHKEYIRGDILIEDSEDNLSRFTSAWGRGARAVLIARPWNTGGYTLDGALTECRRYLGDAAWVCQAAMKMSRKAR